MGEESFRLRRCLGGALVGIALFAFSGTSPAEPAELAADPVARSATQFVGPMRLAGATEALPLSVGRSVIDVEVPAEMAASIGVFGPSRALLGFSVVGVGSEQVQRHTPADEDGLLPRVVTLGPAPVARSVQVIVDLAAPGRIERAIYRIDDVEERAPKALSEGSAQPRVLVGFPNPIDDRAGYLLQTPSRYAFVRSDVAQILVQAFHETQRRYRRDPIYVSDMSQWDGDRPATDQGHPRHISHVGGRDVDLAFPAIDGIPSTVREHCQGVLTDEDVLECGPGTVKGLDAERLTYLLGRIVDLSPPGGVVKIYMDEAYHKEILRVLPLLVERRWIEEEGQWALGEDGVVVASPWHTDHLHLRFRGEAARTHFEPSSAADEDFQRSLYR